MAQRKSWSTEEDQYIRLKVEHNNKLPEKDKLKWGDIADHLNKAFPQSHRSGKQCRQRWHNQLDPEIVHSEWSPEEQRKLFELQKKLGNKWAQIASQMKGRTDNNVKNYFYSTLRKSLRKLNSFISLNRMELKAAKQFKQSSLSKLLAVADHKFDKKINVKKVTAQSQAVEIKNMLIEIIRLQVGDLKARALFVGLVKRLQQWNKCCKKKKGKKKQQVEVGQEDGQEQISGQEDGEQQDQNEQVENKNNALQNSDLSRKPRINRSRSRNNKAPLQKKQSDRSISSRKQKVPKKPVKQQKKQKQQPQLPQIPQINKKQSSKQYSNASGNNFIDMSRSSLDLGKYKKNSSNSSLNQSSNLFKSFIIDGNPDHNHEMHQKSSQKGQQSRCKVTRSSSNFGFLDMIKQVSFQRKQSQPFDDFLHQDDGHNLFGIKMLKRQSSRRQLPMVKDESFAGFGSLDQSIRFEPQIKKLRSWRKDSSNFQMEYRFENNNLN